LDSNDLNHMEGAMDALSKVLLITSSLIKFGFYASQ
jgi:hypothetical protein